MKNDLISRSALKSYIDCGHLRPPTEKCFSELDVVRMLDKQPTIDAVPMVHGRWIKSNKHIWRKRKDGEIDHFAVDFEYHNGPECEICGLHFCEHCHPEKFDEESCKDQYFCSVCGRMEMKEEPYCHCGAQMDGGTSDGN